MNRNPWQHHIETARSQARTDREKLVAQWLPLVIRECQRLGRVDDDSLQIGAIGLLNAARDYRPELGHFAAIACTYIRGELANDWRYHNRAKRSGRQREKLGDYEDSFNWEAIEAGTEDPWRFVDGRYAEVMKAYFHGESMTEIARRLGLTKERVRQKVNAGLAEARKRARLEFRQRLPSGGKVA